MIWIIFAFITGCFVGITIMAVLSAAKEDERPSYYNAKTHYKRKRNCKYGNLKVVSIEEHKRLHGITTNRI
ncbi:hypothetical protein KVG29_04965 [Caldicoprobacter algeriensis]|uniref:hypothetical protein n=1 Tax=Caldicoprobacter algeriensis TaxID=699281 RepID=UPI00207A360F|nr:hypothetical protein [Caldicoprobacter algeriensis]MCM8900578.1 hypothetical protein [Caldicoprobacter algeriensis]